MEGWLADGLSLEEIGRRAGLHVSTVGYWVKHHGLRAARADLRRAKGGLDRERLEALVGRDLSVRQIAAEVDRSIGTVRYWLRYHGLETSQNARKAGPRVVRRTGHCPAHGITEFAVRRDAPDRCLRCRAEAVSNWRRRAKKMLIEEAGGCCIVCGYDACPTALHFHHRDPAQKRFGIGSRGLGRSLEKVRAEAVKCVLLCSNCHAEVESGYRRLDLQSNSGLSSEVAHSDPG